MRARSLDRGAREDVAELADQGRAVVRPPEGADQGEREREQRKQREQRVVGEHRRQVRAAGARRSCGGSRARAARAGAAASGPSRAGLGPRAIAAAAIRGRRGRGRDALALAGLRDARGLVWYGPRAATSRKGAYGRARSARRPQADLGADHRRGDRRQRGLARPRRCRTAPRASVSCAWRARSGRRPSRLARDLGRDALTQVEVATPEGSVFVRARRGAHVVATTTADPTVGPRLLRPAHLPAHRRGGLAARWPTRLAGRRSNGRRGGRRWRGVGS